jgi:hypothetical protein
MILGAFGPWARVLGLISVSGTDAGDGWILIAGGLVAAVVLWLAVSGIGSRNVLLPIAVLAAVAGAVTAAIDFSSLRSVANDAGPPRAIFAGEVISAGWGIYVALIASIALGLSTIVLWIELQRGPAGSVPTGAAEREESA